MSIKLNSTTHPIPIYRHSIWNIFQCHFIFPTVRTPWLYSCHLRVSYIQLHGRTIQPNQFSFQYSSGVTYLIAHTHNRSQQRSQSVVRHIISIFVTSCNRKVSWKRLHCHGYVHRTLISSSKCLAAVLSVKYVLHVGNTHHRNNQLEIVLCRRDDQRAKKWTRGKMSQNEKRNHKKFRAKKKRKDQK